MNQQEPWPHRIGYRSKDYQLIGGELHYARKGKHHKKNIKVAFYEPLNSLQFIAYYIKGLMHYLKVHAFAKNTEKQ
jgi:hypothetical protein